jgi:hypothetical protein
MATDDLLQQFDKLIQKRLDAQDQKFQKLLEENNKQLRLEIREDNKADIRAEVDPLHERMDTQYKNLSSEISTVEKNLSTTEKNLSGKIDQQTHDVADILAKAVMPDIDRHETEIKELQEAVGLRPKQ